MKVQVITDSTSDIPEDLVSELGIRVVPIYLRFGDKTYRDGVDMTKDEFYSMLISSPVHPATSQPNPEDFTSVYRESQMFYLCEMLKCMLPNPVGKFRAIRWKQSKLLLMAL